MIMKESLLAFDMNSHHASGSLKDISSFTPEKSTCERDPVTNMDVKVLLDMQKFELNMIKIVKKQASCSSYWFNVSSDGVDGWNKLFRLVFSTCKEILISLKIFSIKQTSLIV